MSVIDQNDDFNGQHLYRILKLYDVPEFVKNASSDDIYGKKLSNHLYGDPVGKTFPCHSAAATWVSTAFFIENKSNITEKIANWVDERIKAASHRFYINNFTDQIRSKYAETFTDALGKLSDRDFAVVFYGDHGAKERYYPLRNTKEVVKAADYILKYRMLIPIADRREMAKKVLEKASSFGAAVDNDFLSKQAGIGSCNPEDVAELLWSRTAMIGRTDKPNDLQIQMAKMADACGKHQSDVCESDSLNKIAEVVDSIDRHYGFNQQYDDNLLPPEDILFKLNEKIAAKVVDEHCILTSGNVYKIADFDRLQIKDIQDLMGNEFSKEVSDGELFVSPEKFANVVKTLPRPDAELIERLFKDVGLFPVTKQASARLGPDKEQWHAFAQQRITGKETPYGNRILT